MVPFLKADQLKKLYTVFGCFYDLEIDGTITLPCRNVLEIFECDTCDPNSEAFYKPDALVIMMNPGKSKPLDENFVPPKVKSRNLNLIISKETLVPAKPDKAQYQIMRLMRAMQWRHVRMICLSDIREPDTRKFAQIIEKPKISRHLVHSIFSEKRTNERQSALQLKKGAPIIAAWGKEEFLEPLARQCLSTLPDGVAGLPYKDNPHLFYHACPSLPSQKQEWLDKMCEQLS